MGTLSKLKKRYFGKKSMLQLYLLAIIPIACIILFCYVPMSGILIAFKDYSVRKGILGSP